MIINCCDINIDINIDMYVIKYQKSLQVYKTSLSLDENICNLFDYK